MQHKCAAPRGEQDSSRSSKKVKIVYGSVERTIEKKGKRSTREKERECGRCRGELELLDRRGGSVFFHCHFLLLLTPKISRAVSMCLMWGACAQRPLTHAHTHITTHTYVQRQLFVCWLKGRSCVFSFFCLKVLLLLCFSCFVDCSALGIWHVAACNAYLTNKQLICPTLPHPLFCPLLAIAIKVVEGRQLVKLFGAGKQVIDSSRFPLPDSW